MAQLTPIFDALVRKCKKGIHLLMLPATPKTMTLAWQVTPLLTTFTTRVGRTARQFVIL